MEMTATITTSGNAGLRVKAAIKSGTLSSNHNVGNHNAGLKVKTSIWREARGNHNAGLKVKTAIQGGRLSGNHNAGLRVKTAIKGGRLSANYNQRMA